MATTTKKKSHDGALKHLSRESQEFYRNAFADYELDSHHLILLVKALEAFDLAEKCRKILDKEGITYIDRFNAPRARSENRILNDSRNAVKNIFRELGFELADDNGVAASFDCRKVSVRWRYARKN